MDPQSTEATIARMKRPATLPPEVWPFSSKILRIRGHALHFVDEGRGPVLLMTHAGPAWSFLFRDLIRELRPDFRCVAVDLPDTGLSTSAPGFGNTIEENAEVFRAFVEALDLRDITLVLSDIGGPVGLRMAGLVPDRVRAFVLAGTFGFPLTDSPGARRMMRFVSGRTFGAANRLFDLMPRAISGPGTRLRVHTKVEKLAWRTPTLEGRKRNRWQRLFQDGADNAQILSEVEKSLKTVFADRAALLAYGEKDPARKMGWQARFEGIFSSPASTVFPGAMHFAIEEVPKEAARQIRAWHRRTARKGSASQDSPKRASSRST